jgi:hypothetical protein
MMIRSKGQKKRGAISDGSLDEINFLLSFNVSEGKPGEKCYQSPTHLFDLFDVRQSLDWYGGAALTDHAVALHPQKILTHVIDRFARIL